MRADVVTDWNDIASQAALQLAVPPRPGPSAILDLAMVHVAMHDAIQAYEDRKGFLVRECGQNVAVREKVEALLRQHETPTEFLNAPAAEMVPATLIAGSVLGPYQIIEVAGAGGMGQVYRARDSRLSA